MIKNDCSKRTGDLNIEYFVNNCALIMEQQAYLPIADQKEVTNICGQVKKDFNKEKDKCESVSKNIIQLYFKQDIEKIIMYVMKYSTSDSFIQVINENFIDLGWDMAAIDFSSSNDNFGSQLANSQLLGQIDGGALVQAQSESSNLLA